MHFVRGLTGRDGLLYALMTTGTVIQGRLIGSAECEELGLFKSLFGQHHYLGLQNTVGENLKYLIKDVYVYPLNRHFRKELCDDHP